MTDKELLEYAAKAAGMVYPKENCLGEECVGTNEGSGVWNWNPLTDDGDALRLAVKLHLFDGRAFETQRIALAVGKRLKFKDHVEEDEYAATRRAIVRASAEIGKAMP